MPGRVGVLIGIVIGVLGGIGIGVLVGIEIGIGLRLGSGCERSRKREHNTSGSISNNPLFEPLSLSRRAF